MAAYGISMNKGRFSSGGSDAEFEILISVALPDGMNDKAGDKVYIVETRTNNVMWEGKKGELAEITSFRPISVAVMLSSGQGGWISSDTRQVAPGKKYGLIFDEADISSRSGKVRIIEQLNL